MGSCADMTNPFDRIDAMMTTGELSYLSIGVASSNRGDFYAALNKGAKVVARGYGSTAAAATSNALSKIEPVLELPGLN